MMRFRVLFLCVFAYLAVSCGSKQHGTNLPPRAVQLPDGVLLDEAGALNADDITVSGAYADRFQLAVTAGSPLSVELTSTAFDPMLEVILPDGGRLINDDWQGDRQRSRVEFAPTADGIVKIMVTSYAPDSAGAYRVRVRRDTVARSLAAAAPTSGSEAATPPPATVVATTPDPQASPGAPPPARNHHLPPLMHTGAPVRVGSQIRGTLAAADPRLPSGEYADAFMLDAPLGTRLAFEVTSDAIDSYLMVVGPAGQLWENDDSGGSRNAHVAMTTPAAGSYQVVVTSYRAGETGGYALKTLDASTIASGALGPDVSQEVEVPEAPREHGAGPIVRTGALTASSPTLQSGEHSDRHAFMWTAGQRLSISLSSAVFDTYVIVVAPSGQQQDNDDIESGNTNSALEYTVTETGPHTLIVTSYQPGETGAYELAIAEAGAAGSPAAPPPPTVPAPLPGPAPTAMAASVPLQQGQLAAGDATLRSGEFSDNYTYEWPAGQPVHLELNSSDFDTYLIVHPPTGPQQDNDDVISGNTNSAIDFVSSEAGTYRVTVTSYRPGEQGRYRLTVGSPSGAPAQPSPTGTAASPTAPQNGAAAGQLVATGAHIAGRLATGDSQLPSGEFTDRHMLQFAQGESLRIHLASAQFDPYLLVRTPSGRRIDNDDMATGTRDAAVDLPLAETGTYEVIVTSYRPGEQGNYDLQVERGASVAGLSEGGGRLWGVFAGISDYPGSGNDLPECANDAIKLAETLRGAGLLVPERQVVLTDAQATVAGVRSAMQRVAEQMRPDDVFVFFYSGHGGHTDGGSRDAREIDGADEYLVLYDGNLLDDEMGRMFDTLHSHLSLLALDSCFSGGFAKDVVTRPGRVGLFSSEEDMTSGVASNFQAGGYLSHFLRTAVGGEADADPRDRVLTVGELTHYLTLQFGSQVRDVRMSEGYQHLVVDRGAVHPADVLWASR